MNRASVNEILRLRQCLSLAMAPSSLIFGLLEVSVLQPEYTARRGWVKAWTPASLCGRAVEPMALHIDHLQQKLSVDPSHSSTDDGSCEEICGSALKLAGNEPLRLHVFVDRSTVEGFANGRACVFHRIRPLLEDSVNVELVATGGEAEVTTLSAWRKEAVKITGLDN